ncbi:MAG: sulfatase-like hydrolase/transferase [Alphaproteobacteria bacterium]|nr:sulfatase-like hydrolase/transferase [Alphaproteobacteria bacterium]
MKTLSIIIFFLSYMLMSSAKWAIRKFGEMSYEQVIFHLNTPLDSETKLICSYLQNTVMIAVILVVVLYFISKKISPRKLFSLSILFLICTLSFSWRILNIDKIIKEYDTHITIGDFYEKYYVDLHKISIKAPEHKRNLIMIFAESMENTYANANYFDDNLIPELTTLANDNISFSHNDSFGGFKVINGAKYTQASLVSQLCAIPLRLPINASLYRPKNGFLPGALCLSDILKKDGYNQSFMIGMTRAFSGTDKYLETHGNVKILDWDFYSKRDNLDKNTDKRRKRIVRDEKLFSYAKEEILNLYNQKEPFAFTIMTLDTHFGDEHFDSQNCKVKYHSKDVKDDEYFKNVISCSSSKINNFIEWIKTQPFYDNTEIVIVGDHLTMGEAVKFDKNMDRTMYNVYINSSSKDNIKTKNRLFTALDTLPTMLEGLGYTIDGNKLGLGVSLFSGKATLMEQGISFEQLNTELDKQSKIYNKILYGKDVGQMQNN